jgi:hypothetical protein
MPGRSHVDVDVDLDLARTQRWMQAVVTDLDSVEAGIRSRAARKEIAPAAVARFILPSPTLTSPERLEVYQGMYFLRMRDALLSDYPVTARFLGDEGFAALVRGYVKTHPSRTYTLNRLGDRLPAYVRRTPGIPERGFLADLVGLELAITEVFDAFSSPALTPEAVAAVPAEAWERARLVPVEAFRLLALAHPANDYLQAVRDEKRRLPPRRPRANRLAVYRSGLDVYRFALERDAHDLLALLVKGVPLGRAIARARVRHRRLGETRVFVLFRDWIAAGFFRAVEVAPQPRANSSATARRKRAGSIAGKR